MKENITAFIFQIKSHKNIDEYIYFLCLMNNMDPVKKIQG
jgi:hypothetical protein